MGSARSGYDQVTDSYFRDFTTAPELPKIEVVVVLGGELPGR